MAVYPQPAARLDLIVVIATGRQRVADGDCRDAWTVAQIAFQLQEEGHLTFRGWVGGLAKGDRCGSDIFRVDSQALFLKVQEAVSQQGSACKEDHACGNLSDDEPAAHEGMAHGGLGAAGESFRAGFACSRDQTEENGAEERGCESEGEDTKVDMCCGEEGHPIRSHEDEEAQQQDGEETRGNAAGEGQEERLGQCLPDEPHPAGSQCRPNRQFFLPACAARQQQAGDIGAGNEEDGDDETEENPRG